MHRRGVHAQHQVEVGNELHLAGQFDPADDRHHGAVLFLHPFSVFAFGGAAAENEQPHTGHLRKHRDHPLHLFERIDFALMLRERRDPDPFFPFVRPCKRFGFCIQRVPHARRNGYRRQVEPQCEENFAVAFDRRFELYQFFILQRNERLFLFPAFIDISYLCAAQPQDAPQHLRANHIVQVGHHIETAELRAEFQHAFQPFMPARKIGRNELQSLNSPEERL